MNRYIFLILLFGGFYFANALYEDQIEKFDWYKQFIGQISDLAIPLSSSDEKYIYATSAAHVLAAISTKNGSLIWRQVLEENRKFIGSKLCGSYFISISDGPSVIIRMWDSRYGYILSEFLISVPPSESWIFCMDDDQLAKIIIGQRILILRLNTREIIFDRNALNNSTEVFKVISASRFDNNEEVMLLSGGLEPVLVTSAGRTASPSLHTQRLQLAAEGSLLERCLVEQNASLFVIFCTGSEASGSNFAYTTSLREDGQLSHWTRLRLHEKPIGLTRLSSSHILVSFPFRGDVYTVKASGEYAIAFIIPNFSLGTPIQIDDRIGMLVMEQDMKKDLKNVCLRVYDLATGRVELSRFPDHLTISPHHGRIEKVALVASEGGRKHNLLIATEDHALQLISSSGHQLWVREESLADIVSVEMIDLPVSPQQASMQEEFGNRQANVFELFANRIISQMSQMMSSIKLWLASARNFILVDEDSASNGVEDSFPDGSSPHGSHRYTPLYRDVYNLRKMLVLVTSVGKVFGVDSQQGRIVWQYLVPGASAQPALGKALFLQLRTTAHFPLHPLAALILTSKSTKLPMIFFFDPITGWPLNEALMPTGRSDVSESLVHLNRPLLQAFLSPAPVSDKIGYLRPIFTIDDELKVRVFPSMLADRRGLLPQPLYLFTVEEATANITGYFIQAHPTGYPEYSLQMAWSMRLSSQAQPEKIISIASRPSNEHIYSIGLVLGDRSVLYKYVNPNLLAVMTSGQGGQDNSETVSLHLVDTVAGRILHSAQHQRCRPPFSLVLSENWILYSVYNQRSLRSEFIILELFEVMGDESSLLMPSPWQVFVRSLSRFWLSVAPSAGLFSSLQRSANSAFGVPHRGLIEPHILQRAYILPTPIRPGTVAVSLTERGITSKSILFGLESGSLLELPKSLLDPRRALDMTPELQEEGLEPYSPELPLTTYAVLSYNRSLHRISHIHTAPSGLESTGLVFVRGLDLFFTRIAPSKNYDLLKDDFDNRFIAMIILGMIVATLLTHRLAVQKELKAAWQ